MNDGKDSDHSFTDENEGWLAERLQRARRGDEQALDELVRHYRDYLMQIAKQNMDGRLRPRSVRRIWFKNRWLP